MDTAHAFLADRGNSPADLRFHLEGTARSYAKTLLALLGAANKKVKNRAAKLLAQLSQDEPKVLHPEFGQLAALVAAPDTIVRWNALIAVGFLSRGADSGAIDALLPELFGLLKDPSMITAGHAITSLGRIAASHEEHADAIVAALLDSDSPTRDPECRSILAGKTLAAMDPPASKVAKTLHARLVAFARSHADDSRPATRKLATRCVRQWQG